MIKQCRSCGGKELETIVDLGEQYVSDFRDDDSKPPKYPIEALICKDCMLVQLGDTTPSREMYHENYGFKSNVNESIKKDLEAKVDLALEYSPHPKNWLDIASNDGTLLSFVPPNIYRVGVDPIKKLCAEAKQHADWIINGFFNTVPFQSYNGGSGHSNYDKFDVITSISMFYDIDDPNGFVGDVKTVLAEDGVWIIQQNYLMTTIELGALDNFCHEHLEYYTLLSLKPLLERHGLEIVGVETSMVNGGSLITAVAHKGVYPIQKSVAVQFNKETAYGLNTMEPYREFAVKAQTQILELRALIRGLVDRGKKIYILAASTRGSTIWQAAHLDEREIGAAVERNPEKVGKYFSAIGVPIISEEQAHKDRPDFMLVGPWFFRDQIVQREQRYLANGGHLIMPLPNVEVI